MANTPYCPVDEANRAWLNYRWAWLCNEFGTKGLKQRPLVLPAPEFFPDTYDRTPEDVEKLVHRVARYMEIDPSTLEVHFYQEQQDPLQTRHQGTTGLYLENESGKFEIWLEVSQITEPGRMIATIAHELGHVLLLGQKRITHDEADHEQLTDLITVFMGLGVFNANNMLQESNVRSGGAYTWSIGRQGYLAMYHFGYAFALYARTREEANPAWLKHLRLDVRKACKQSLKILADNPLPTVQQLQPVEFPIVTKPDDHVVAEEQVEDERNENRGLCIYCGSGTTSVETTGSTESQDIDICDACQRSMNEADSHEITPEQLRKAGMYDRFMLWFFLGFLQLAALSYLFGRGDR